ncbi:MAG TPA: Na+/H+ antiporter subunit E [Caldithrix abyssi]|uniref:Na+/H+ antiporter subunit E n=1 Tax=Caldithrix abyssi TaxID=187145 RepID=A0A7V4TZ14_CALAY|nr:Na+/H+ antiporter subunit E [Caldithrix abyssi]
MSKFIFSFIVYFAFWVAFTSTLRTDEVLAGAIVALLMSWLTGQHFSETGMKNLSPRKLWYAFLYLFVFLWEMLKANVDVARRVIMPKIPINPGIVEVPTKLQSNIAKLALANSITLTPGTLTVDIIDDKLYIHWIDVRTEEPEEAFRQISGVFEKYIKEIFE